MDKYYLEPTKVTPLINFDPSEGILELKGRSSPENPIEMYSILISKLDDFAQNGSDSLNAHIEFEYFNTSSSKCLFDILKRISSMQDSGKNIQINWAYEDGDEDMMEAGEDFSDLLDIEFNFVVIDE